MLSQQDLRDMMDRIEELMRQGRMAEAEALMRQFQQMMENLRMTDQGGEGGEGSGGAGAQALEGWPIFCASSRACRTRRFAICRNSLIPARGRGGVRQYRAERRRGARPEP